MTHRSGLYALSSEPVSHMHADRHKLIVSYGLHWPEKKGSDSERKMTKNLVNLIANDVPQDDNTNKP